MALPRQAPGEALFLCAGEVIHVAVYQCPECPLRFAYGSELEAHLREDHAGFHLEGMPGHHAEQFPAGASAPTRGRTLLERLRKR